MFGGMQYWQSNRNQSDKCCHFAREEEEMSSRQHSIEANAVTREVTATRHKGTKQPDNERWQTILDDPSFRRLLRDGHQADTTTLLLAQLEGNE